MTIPRWLSAFAAAFALMPLTDWPALCDGKPWQPDVLAGASLLIVAALLHLLDDHRRMRRELRALRDLRDKMPAGVALRIAAGARDRGRA